MPRGSAWLTEVANAVAVQLFKRVPWLGTLWARRHRFVESTTAPWAPLGRPVRQSRIALVTTAGVHLRTDPPFDMGDPDGDPSFRTIPSDADARGLTITHKYYDHGAADRDINVVLPLARLRELLAEGRIGGIAPRAYSFMGHIDGRHLATLVERTAPAVAARLHADDADAVVLTPA
ncbi:MAG TPA: glycine/sarcosine/betaine reductase selenoprotein B family protein [Methylomirabilota bacterium]|jgi:D-proline reductase (dithiol) PrdB|nr:glycine/sarcosine/betaine reductase selenoprotein B family protein [Methylomirabilota bacterium]